MREEDIQKRGIWHHDVTTHFFFFIPIFNGAPLSVSFGLDLVHQWIFLIISLNYTLEV